jgi:hypothetical protein
MYIQMCSLEVADSNATNDCRKDTIWVVAVGAAERPGSGLARAELRALAGMCRGVLLMPASLPPARYSLFAADGRRVLDLKPGPNDVSRLAPGVYFVRDQGSEIRAQGAAARPRVRKIVIQRQG